MWQTLYGHLKYGEKERRWFYDLILHHYFKLDDLNTVNLSFLITKLVRDATSNGGTVERVRLQMKELLAVHGSAVVEAVHGGSAEDFAAIFGSIQEVDPELWETVYHKLVEWSLDESLRRDHRSHQKRFKNKLMSPAEPAEEVKDHDITVFDDITRVSIRHDIDYSNSEEGREWKQYRHRLKNVFKVFAGTKASKMSKRELKRFLAILDVKQFWSQHLLQDTRTVAMDEFLKYLCNEFVC